MGSVVLVTGVSRNPGARLAARLAAESSVERIIGVDTTAPAETDRALLGRTEFVRADIRNPLIARVIARAGVDTVVHASVTAMPREAGGRGPMKEFNVIGTMQLLAACQKSESMRRLVVKSTTAVYGSSARDPAVFTEQMQAKAVPRSGYAKDAVEVEGYVRGFSRRRPDIAVTVLRFANFIGPAVDTPLTRYFALPIVPTGFGFDPRLQLVHEDDAVAVLSMAALADRPGVFNVAGDGVLLLSQALRRAGRMQLPLPQFTLDFFGGLVRRSGAIDFSPEQLRLLNFGRVVDTTRLRERFAYTPRYTTAEALASFGHAGRLPLSVPAARVRQAERVAGRLLGVRAGVSLDG